MITLSLLNAALVFLAQVVGGQAAPVDFPKQCADLASSLKIQDGTISFTQFVPANTSLALPPTAPSCNQPAAQFVSVDLCRVGLNITTSTRSSLRMEAWLPLNWTGRFLSIGNGGLGGCITYEDLEYAASLGFSTVGTNNGHDGQSGLPFFNNIEVINDFAYRAVHVGVVAGKQISQTFYKRRHTKSYYLGCSTGGRQGFKSAFAYPEDFDGIVAGAPAISFNNLTSWSAGFYPLTGPPGSGTFPPLALWPVIHQDVHAKCDALDGVVDGILEAPDLCQYDPKDLVCAQGQNSSCLTPTQAETVRKIYSPLRSADGSFVYPRLQPGAEGAEAPFAMFNGIPFGSSDWFKYAVLSDPNWDPATLKPADYDLSSRLNLGGIETWHGDLSAYKKRGGKILHYHGSQDGIISSEISPRYYEHVSRTMGQSPARLDEFYRFFRISGLQHCGRGNGAGFIGNRKANTASLRPDENVLMATVQWVERGIAPDTITGIAVRGGSLANGVDYKRRHCRWPYRNQYKGVGDAKNEDSWHCVR
ncbi:Tannase/feruloyl esterase [Pyrenochaeta sp. MPI-SDFR-AT-0127]|nr:Tannase/feruloyl esterase [Pyrenochaeta sp. MPI-SDFR-AT-0127]